MYNGGIEPPFLTWKASSLPFNLIILPSAAHSWTTTLLQLKPTLNCFRRLISILPILLLLSPGLIFSLFTSLASFVHWLNSLFTLVLFVILFFFLVLISVSFDYNYFLFVASLDGQFIQRTVLYSPWRSTSRLLFNPSSILPFQMYFRTSTIFLLLFDLTILLVFFIAIVSQIVALSIWIILACLHPLLPSLFPLLSFLFLPFFLFFSSFFWFFI